MEWLGFRSENNKAEKNSNNFEKITIKISKRLGIKKIKKYESYKRPISGRTKDYK